MSEESSISTGVYLNRRNTTILRSKGLRLLGRHYYNLLPIMSHSLCHSIVLPMVRNNFPRATYEQIKYEIYRKAKMRNGPFTMHVCN
jgi:hypothetical protein